MLAKATAADDSVSLTLSESIAKFEARAPSLLLAPSWEGSEGHAHTMYQTIVRLPPHVNMQVAGAQQHRWERRG
jgi:hypothetical protein